MAAQDAPPVGTMCTREERTSRATGAAFGTTPLPPHPIVDPKDDEELQRVKTWLLSRPSPLHELLATAVMDTLDYVLDGAYTGRFYLLDKRVDSGERALVGTKLEYRVLKQLELQKQPPLDTRVEGVSVDIKNTIRSSWMIPTECQCEICLLVRIDATNDRFSARLMRTHRILLGGRNKDGKRGTPKASVERYSVPLFHELWAPLPRNPLRNLSDDQIADVFHPKHGQTRRFTALFGYLPRTVISRRALATVGFDNDDPLRRVRQAREHVLKEHNLVLLCGKWPVQREAAATLGHTLGPTDWVALPSTPELVSIMKQK